MPGLDVGQHQVVFGREVVVQAHAGHAGSGNDRVDTGGRDPIRVEQARCGLQQLGSGARLVVGHDSPSDE